MWVEVCSIMYLRHYMPCESVCEHLCVSMCVSVCVPVCECVSV